MKLKKQMFLPVLLSLSVFFSSTVAMSASAYAAAAPASVYASDMSAARASSAAPRTAAVRQLAEAAPKNTDIPEVEKGKTDRTGSARSRSDSSFFEDLLEKIAVMFLVYMFIQTIHEILNEFFHDDDTKIKITPKENQEVPGGKGTNQKNNKQIPAQEV